MPIYEYQCLNCSHSLEVMQKISDSPLMSCPKCGKNTLEKVISSTAFQLKGTGWYVTDFKTSGQGKKETSSITSESSSESKSEHKPPSTDEKKS